jgi:hypothetical protein
MKAIQIYVAASLMLLSLLAGGCGKDEDPRGQWEIPDSMIFKPQPPFVHLPEVDFLLNDKGIISYVMFSNESTYQPFEYAAEFFRDVLNIQEADLFRMDVAKSQSADFTYEHFVQYHKGIKVDGGEYTFTYHNQIMYSAYGNYVKIDGLNLKPSITAEEAGKIVADFFNIPLEEVISYSVELVIREIWELKGAPAMLAYKVFLSSRIDDATAYVFAHSGEIVGVQTDIVCDF